MMKKFSHEVTSTLAATLLLFSMENVLAEKYTPTNNEKINVNCSCISPEGGAEVCALNILDKAAGSPRHSWNMYQYGQAGKEIDLTSSCYRKREVEGMGDGVCCAVLDDDSKAIQRLFLGVKQ